MDVVPIGGGGVTCAMVHDHVTTVVAMTAEQLAPALSRVSWDLSQLDVICYISSTFLNPFRLFVSLNSRPSLLVQPWNKKVISAVSRSTLLNKSIRALYL